MTEKRDRMYHFDLLRIFAAFSVVMLHVAAQFWYDLDKQSSEWVIANSYDALFRFGVPIFVMLSGSIFLNPNYQLNLKRLYIHNILRIILIYVFWSCAYGIFDITSFNLQAVGFKEILREMLMGRYHLWFLPMIVGIYLLLPILKSWINSAKTQNIQYFIFLFLLFQVGIETLRAITVTDELHYLLDLCNIEMACSYIGYFVWGYYLTHVGISIKSKKILYILFVPSLLLNVILGNFLIKNTDAHTGIIYDSFGIFTFIIATVLFLLTQEYGSKLNFSSKSARIIHEISSDTLGIYVIHVGLMEYLMHYGIHCMLLPNIIGIPLYTIFIFAICLILTYIIRKIPIIGKLIS